MKSPEQPESEAGCTFTSDQHQSFLNDATRIRREEKIELPVAVRRALPSSATPADHRAVMKLASKRSAKHRSAEARRRRYERGEPVERQTRDAPPPTRPRQSQEEPREEDDLFGYRGPDYGSGV